MRNKKKIIPKKSVLRWDKTRLFWIFCIILFIWYVLIRPEYNNYKLRKEGQAIKGRIYRKSSVGSKGTIRSFYTFEVEGKTYEGFNDNPQLKQWDSIEIIYYKQDPSLNQAKQFVEEY